MAEAAKAPASDGIALRSSRLFGRGATTAIVALLLVMALVSVGRASGNVYRLLGSVDFGVVVKGAEVMARENVYERYVRDRIYTTADRGPGINPMGSQPVQVPSVLALFWPFTLIPWNLAKSLWLALNLFCTAGLLLLAFKRLLPGRPALTYAAIGSLFLISVAWRNVIGNGQHTIVALFLFLLADALAERQRPFAAGLALALALVKYSLVLFLLPLLVMKRQWLPLAIALAVHGLLTLLVAFHLQENPVWLIGQSLAVMRKLQSDGYVDLFAAGTRLGLPALVSAAIAVAGLGVAAWALVRGGRQDPALALAALAMIAVLLVYHRFYDSIVLLLPLLVAIDRWRSDRRLALAVFVTVALVWFVATGRHWHAWLEDGGPVYWVTAASFYATCGLLLARLARPHNGTARRGSMGDQPVNQLWMKRYGRSRRAEG
jgi:hypothetical protein